ncbi:MAG: hypothetical protein GC154_02760 [bacterium]|nr:hypothetical protein [bacterium]
MEWLSSALGHFASIFSDFNFWTIIGYIGQLFFGGSFVVQWIASERKRESVIPVSFWYMRLVGSVILLAYAVLYLKDQVMILGFLFNSSIYIRNLYFIHKKTNQAAA